MGCRSGLDPLPAWCLLLRTCLAKAEAVVQFYNINNNIIITILPVGRIVSEFWNGREKGHFYRATDRIDPSLEPVLPLVIYATLFNQPINQPDSL